MRLNPPQRIILINIFGIGDVLFTTPLINNLKAAYPDIFIGYLCNRRTIPLLEHNSKISRIFIYERDELETLRQKSAWQYLKAVRRLIQDIRGERFDMVLDVSLNSFMSFLAFAAGIPRRIGYDYKGRGIFLTQRIPLAGYEDRHVAEYYLDLLAAFGVPAQSRDMEFPLIPEDIQWAAEFLEENRISVPPPPPPPGGGRGGRGGRVVIRNTPPPPPPPPPPGGGGGGGGGAGWPVIGLIPGGGESWGKDAGYKRWPAECFAKLADKLVEKKSATIILMGGLVELDLCEKTAQLMQNRPIETCGKTSLGQFAALMQSCSLVVTNDGGPLHVAVAVGAKTVSIFGPVDERVYGPYPLGNHIVIKKDIVCRPCYRQFRKASCEHISCLRQITVEDVLERVEKIS